MKKIFIAVLLTAGIAFLCLANYWGQKEIENIEEAFAQSILDDDRLQNEIIPRLNRAIKARPDNLRLIKLRMNVLEILGLLQKAKLDVERIIELTNSNAYRFHSCWLAESMGEGRKDEYIQCYRDVYALYIAQVKDAEGVHVLAASMGEIPDAENIRTRYLESISNQEMRQWCSEALVPFKRERLLLPYSKEEDEGTAAVTSGLK